MDGTGAGNSSPSTGVAISDTLSGPNNLTVNMSDAGYFQQFAFNNPQPDVEVGSLTFDGSVASDTGRSASTNGVVEPAGTMNSANGNPVTLNKVELRLDGTTLSPPAR